MLPFLPVLSPLPLAPLPSLATGLSLVAPSPPVRARPPSTVRALKPSLPMAQLSTIWPTMARAHSPPLPTSTPPHPSLSPPARLMLPPPTTASLLMATSLWQEAPPSRHALAPLHSQAQALNRRVPPTSIISITPGLALLRLAALAPSRVTSQTMPQLLASLEL